MLLTLLNFEIFILSVSKNGDYYNSMHLSQFQENAEQIHADILRSQDKLTVNPSDIKIYFFSRTTNGKEVNLANPAEINQTDYSPSKETIFLIHGWINDHRAPMIESIKNAYLDVADVNVFVVDWGRFAFEEYVHARYLVVAIGKTLAELVSSMVVNNFLSLSKTTIVGHSLGAHIAGTTGKALNKELDTIVGKH